MIRRHAAPRLAAAGFALAAALVAAPAWTAEEPNPIDDKPLPSEEAGPRPPPMQIVEQAIETNRNRVRLPSSASGTLAVSNCGPGCPSRLPLAEDAQFLVLDQPVSYAKLLERLSASPTGGLTILYDPQRRVATRLIAD
jgi:hypothetical protein